MDSEALISALRADGPHPSMKDELMLFGQFVGSWDVDVTNILPDGTTRAMKAEWHFGWALQGRAIMDVWICPRRSLQTAESPYEYGATLRFYDPDIRGWRSTWIGPVRHLVRPFIARKINKEIVLEGSFAAGTLTRWIFHTIESRRFLWRNIESTDGGRTWKEAQRMEAHRAG